MFYFVICEFWMILLFLRLDVCVSSVDLLFTRCSLFARTDYQLELKEILRNSSVLSLFSIYCDEVKAKDLDQVLLIRNYSFPLLCSLNSVK